MANTYDIGDLVTMSAVFKAAAVETSPDTTTFKIKIPAGTITIYSASSTELVEDSEGNFHVDFPITSTTAAGTYYYTFIGTGACQVVEEASFEVRPSAF
jgi:uncharacterized protein YfaS (alpha-2-macroglobulin family)